VEIKMIKIILNKKGFSLIEMMVVVVILGLIVLGLVTFFTGGAKSWVAGQSQLEAQRNARQAMDIMVREIRESDSINSSSIITNISFNTPFEVGAISYSLSGSGNSIIRQKNGNSITLIDDVLKFEVTYWDITEDAKDPSSESSEISKVRIILEIDADEDENADITLNSDIDLRNFGL
jgi:prepilin-type N-terminal cleavage/methylation domain-containing protein